MNPITGHSKVSSQLSPISEDDRFDNTYNGYAASDMAIDAEGNAYIVVGRYANRYLVKVIIGQNGGAWKYSRVRKLESSSRKDDLMYGVAFLNGDLYVATWTNYYIRYNTLTGQGVDLGKAGDPYDLTTCQTAPVVRGTIYTDTEGNGNPIASNAKGVDKQEIEIWKVEGGRPVYKSTIETNANGEYNFIVDTITEQYYLRVVNPKINSKPAMQTWAGAQAAGSANGVTAYCMNRETVQREAKNSPGICVGANITDAAPGKGDPSTWAIYSKVQMTTDGVVAIADFALTANANYGDAPVQYNRGKSPSHLAPGITGNNVSNNKLNFIQLGKTVL